MFDYDILKVNDFEIQKDGVKKYYNTDNKEYVLSSNNSLENLVMLKNH